MMAHSQTLMLPLHIFGNKRELQDHTYQQHNYNTKMPGTRNEKHDVPSLHKVFDTWRTTRSINRRLHARNLELIACP